MIRRFNIVKFQNLGVLYAEIGLIIMVTGIINRMFVVIFTVSNNKKRPKM